MVSWKNGILSSSAQNHAILRHFLAPKLFLTHFLGFLEVFYVDLPRFYRFFSPMILKTSCKWPKTTKNWHQPPPPGGYCQLFPIDRRNRDPEVSLEYGRLFGSNMDQISRGFGILERGNALAQCLLISHEFTEFWMVINRSHLKCTNTIVLNRYRQYSSIAALGWPNLPSKCF